MFKPVVILSLSFFASLGIFFGPGEVHKPIEAVPAKMPGDSTVEALYAGFCSGCHGRKVDAFADREWKYGKTKQDLFKSIHEGYESTGMPGFKEGLKNEQIDALADYILKGIANVDRYKFKNTAGQTNYFEAKDQNVRLDTIASDLGVPWAMAFLPGDKMLVTERSNKLFLISKDASPVLITGLPPAKVEMQGGLFDIRLHPQFKKNKRLYISYAAYKVEGKDTLSTTAVMSAHFDGTKLTDQKIIFEALPYAKTRYHYGAKLEFDNSNHLYISVGDRGSSKTAPQGLSSFPGKIHRVKDDGSIPRDNPFVDSVGAVHSTFSRGHRNPQGLALNPFTGELWANEHGPRGGDEINIVRKGNNYGWPVISYGINYDGTTFTEKTAQAGMEQPAVYWIPSIAPSGMAFVNSSRYKNWKGSVLSGSLRFNYLNRSVIKDNKIVEEEILLKDVGRLRDVKMGPDGYIYIATETPGYIFRLVPVK